MGNQQSQRPPTIQFVSGSSIHQKKTPNDESGKYTSFEYNKAPSTASLNNTYAAPPPPNSKVPAAHTYFENNGVDKSFQRTNVDRTTSEIPGANITIPSGRESPPPAAGMYDVDFIDPIHKRHADNVIQTGGPGVNQAQNNLWKT
jgi:hypothetical protein